MTKLAQLFAKREGFGIPGTKPTRFNNPGDLRHSPHSTHPGAPNDIGVIDTLEHGWADLERQLQLYAKRNMTVRDAVYEYAPPEDNNNTADYLAYICGHLPCPPDTTIYDALRII